MELFVNPGEEGDGGVAEGKSEGVGTGGLEEVVPESFFFEPAGAFYTFFFLFGEGGGEILEQFIKGGAEAYYKVYVRGDAVGRVFEADQTSYAPSPVTSLSNYGVLINVNDQRDV